MGQHGSLVISTVASDQEVFGDECDRAGSTCLHGSPSTVKKTCRSGELENLICL